MAMVLTEEQSMLQDAAANFAADRSPVSRFRSLRDAGDLYDAALWTEMVQLGWPGVHVPEAYGGSGLGFQGLGVILEQTGRTLIASPLLSTVAIGASALLLGGTDEQKIQYLNAVVSGDLLFALACEEDPHHRPNHVATMAEKTPDGYKLTGRKTFVLDAPIANFIVVSARTRGADADQTGISLFWSTLQLPAYQLKELTR